MTTISIRKIDDVLIKTVNDAYVKYRQAESKVDNKMLLDDPVRIEYRNLRKEYEDLVSAFDDFRNHNWT